MHAGRCKSLLHRKNQIPVPLGLESPWLRVVMMGLRFMEPQRMWIQDVCGCVSGYVDAHDLIGQKCVASGRGEPNRKMGVNRLEAACDGTASDASDACGNCSIISALSNTHTLLSELSCAPYAVPVASFARLRDERAAGFLDSDGRRQRKFHQ